MQRLILSTTLCPGDVLTLTAAIKSLHDTYPDEYETDVRSTVSEIWQHNPLITPMRRGKGVKQIAMDYPLINRSNQRPVPFLAGYTEHLGERLGRPLTLTTNRPDLYLADDEKNWTSQVAELGWSRPFWLINAGQKTDFTAKQWPVESYQSVVDRTQGRIRWVQVGATEHDHPPLSGVIDLRGQTDHRQLIRLAWNAHGGIGGVSYLMHLLAAWQKPYICLLGGREPVSWVTYPQQQTLHTIGALDCCRFGGCWRSRVVPLDDDDSKNRSLCEYPITGLIKPVGQCMAMIRPESVIHALERYL